MRRKSSKQLFSVLMAATMVMSGISIPVNASQCRRDAGKSVLYDKNRSNVASESREINFTEGEVSLLRCRECREKDFDDSDLAKWGI